MKRRVTVMVPSLVAAGSLLLGSSVYGAGFALMEHSVQGIGRSYAGSAAGAELESSIYYNPAGIAGASGASVLVGTHLLTTSVDFDGGSTYAASGAPLTGGDGGEAGVNSFVPNLYMVTGVSEDVAFGVGLFVPFGLAVEYNAGWVGRYHALESSLQTVNINPTLAWQVSDKFSVGAGLSAQYASATLSSAIDFGTISGVAPGLLDGEGTMTGDDWGYGYDVGVIYAICPESRVGLSYRSKIEHTLEGDAEFTVPGPVLGFAQAQNMFVDTTGSADLELPATASLGGLQKVNEKLTVMFDIGWTEWSSLDELRIQYDSAQPDSVTDESWKDTWRVTLGGEYAANDAWTLRAGAAFDESPIPDTAHRTPRIPDSDRVWLTAGLGYMSSENLTVDVGYARVFFEESDINRISETGDRLAGSYEGSAEVFSLQIKWRI